MEGKEATQKHRTIRVGRKGHRQRHFKVSKRHESFELDIR